MIEPSALWVRRGNNAVALLARSCNRLNINWFYNFTLSNDDWFPFVRVSALTDQIVVHASGNLSETSGIQYGFNKNVASFANSFALSKRM